MKANYKVEKTLGQLTAAQQKIITDFVNGEVRRQVVERLKEERAAAIDFAIDFAIDCVLMTAALQLIEGEGWGTKRRKGQRSKLLDFVNGVTERMCSDVRRFEDDFLFSLQWRLKEHGADFVLSRLKERQRLEREEADNDKN
jgi:hypothetical protein